MIKNYGFVRGLDDPRAYKLGAIELPKTVLRTDGQWGKYLPSQELQHRPSYDTFGCTVFGTENAQQILEIFHNGITHEYAERYNYNLVKISPPGADPHDVAESFRNDGVLSAQLLPMPETYEAYQTPRPMTQSLISQGIAHPWELRHQWVWQKSIDKETRTRLIKEYLTYSPLCVAVTAWKLGPDGTYVDDGQSNTHWTVLYGYNDKGWFIFDSYLPHLKLLSFDHNIECAKRYQLVPSTRKERVSIMQKIINAIAALIGLLKPEPVPVPTPPPVTPPVPPEPQITASVTGMADAIETYEGYFPPSSAYPKGSTSWRNKNPGNIKSNKGNFLKFATYEAGYFALCDYIKRVGRGEHKAYPKNCTIKKFFEVYAPVSDNNDPTPYGVFVADRLNVSTDFLIKDLKGMV